MKSEVSAKAMIKSVIKTLNQMGVTLTGINPDSNPPSYYINIDGARTIQSVEETLKSAYGILWVLTYGKPTDKNKNEKIDLQYEVVNESEAIT